MLPEFPSYLIPLLDSFSETVTPVLYRTEFESGPDRQRSYQCGQYVTRSIQYTCCGCDKMDEFRNWFIKDLANGSCYFKWTDPCTLSDTRARISGGSYSAAPDNTSLASWTISLSIEVFVSNA